MGAVNIQTLCEPFRLARAVNYTTNGYPTRIPTITNPQPDDGTATGQAAIELGNDNGGVSQNAALIVPFATGSSTNTFSIRCIGWRRERSKISGNLDLWLPVNLGEYLCTLGTAAGVAGTDIPASMLFASTIVVTVGSTLAGEAPAENIVSPANNTLGHFMLDLKGSMWLELAFTTGGSATDANALVSLL